MSFRRGFARRTDSTHREIAAGLRAAGCSVIDLMPFEAGIPDLLVGVPRGPFRHRNMLLEIKPTDAKGRPVSHGAKRSLARQAAWAECWRGDAPIFAGTLSEALARLGLVKSASEDRAGMANVEPSEF